MRSSRAQTHRVWMAYPECDERINGMVQRYIESNASDWIYFKLPTPDTARHCEGFHVRYEWTAIENLLITNALCAQ